MSVLATPCLIAAVLAQSPAADSLRLLAQRLPESALVLETRARPLAVREAVNTALTRDDLPTARSLAAAYALAWSDSFLVREVQRFAGWPPERRAGKVWVDSMRRAGIATFGRDGPAAAVRVWRRALVRATAIGDTAGMAAVLGNIGAGLLEDGRPDSAHSYLARSRDLALAVGDLRVEGNAVQLLADVSAERGDLAAARDGYARAVSLRERIGDSRGLASAQNSLGLLAQSAGDPAEARRRFEAALEINRHDGRDDAAAANLVNLAGLASLEGDYGRAEGLYCDALATWRARAQWADAAVALHGLGQLELRRGDYPAARAALREALTIYNRTGPLSEAVAVRRELAGALAAQGDLQGGLDQLRQAQMRADSAGAGPGVRAGLALARADLAVQLNQSAEAERLYTLAEGLSRRVGDDATRAEAQQGRGLSLLERGDYPRAQLLLEAAVRTQVDAGNARGAALTRMSLARLARERGDTVAARRQLARAAADLDRLGDPVATAAALGEQASLETSGVAESLYRQALGQIEGRSAPAVAWGLHAGLARVRRVQGAPDAAVRELRAALAELDRPARSLTLPERRAAYFTDKWDVYADLALVERARGRTAAAFEASERLRAREMLELLAQGRLAGRADTALVAREQDLRRRIAELTRTLEGVSTGAEALRGPDVALAPGAARDALVRAQEAYADLLLELRERAPQHAALVSWNGAAWEDVAQHLAATEAFVEYLVSDSASLAFVVTRDTIATFDLGVGRRELARLVEFARGTLERRGVPGTDSLWRGPLRRLHRHLIAPLEDAGILAGKDRLIIVPHRELHYLPFAALLEGEGPREMEHFLIERYTVVLTPSATVWLMLGRRAAAHAARGILALAPNVEALPASRQEVAAIARLARADAQVLSGGAATEGAFRREASRHRVLHLATYGVLNKQNPLFSFVALAPAAEEDGRLEVHEVFGLDLDADLVVLSACQTGVGSGRLADVPPGDDWVGLTRAFLHAGARNVIATLWPVQDRTTAVLMERFYQGFTGGADPAGALASAQRALLAAPATAHPFYWAGFVPVGGALGRDGR